MLPAASVATTVNFLGPRVRVWSRAPLRTVPLHFTTRTLSEQLKFARTVRPRRYERRVGDLILIVGRTASAICAVGGATGGGTTTWSLGGLGSGPGIGPGGGVPFGISTAGDGSLVQLPTCGIASLSASLMVLTSMPASLIAC